MQNKLNKDQRSLSIDGMRPKAGSKKPVHGVTSCPVQNVSVVTKKVPADSSLDQATTSTNPINETKPNSVSAMTSHKLSRSESRTWHANSLIKSMMQAAARSVSNLITNASVSSSLSNSQTLFGLVCNSPEQYSGLGEEADDEMEEDQEAGVPQRHKVRMHHSKVRQKASDSSDEDVPEREDFRRHLPPHRHKAKSYLQDWMSLQNTPWPTDPFGVGFSRRGNTSLQMDKGERNVAPSISNEDNITATDTPVESDSSNESFHVHRHRYADRTENAKRRRYKDTEETHRYKARAHGHCEAPKPKRILCPSCRERRQMGNCNCSCTTKERPECKDFIRDSSCQLKEATKESHHQSEKEKRRHCGTENITANTMSTSAEWKLSDVTAKTTPVPYKLCCECDTEHQNLHQSEVDYTRRNHKPHSKRFNENRCDYGSEFTLPLNKDRNMMTAALHGNCRQVFSNGRYLVLGENGDQRDSYITACLRDFEQGHTYYDENRQQMLCLDECVGTENRQNMEQLSTREEQNDRDRATRRVTFSAENETESFRNSRHMPSLLHHQPKRKPIIRNNPEHNSMNSYLMNSSSNQHNVVVTVSRDGQGISKDRSKTLPNLSYIKVHDWTEELTANKPGSRFLDTAVSPRGSSVLRKVIGMHGSAGYLNESLADDNIPYLHDLHMDRIGINYVGRKALWGHRNRYTENTRPLSRSCQCPCNCTETENNVIDNPKFSPRADDLTGECFDQKPCTADQIQTLPPGCGRNVKLFRVGTLTNSISAMKYKCPHVENENFQVSSKKLRLNPFPPQKAKSTGSVKSGHDPVNRQLKCENRGTTSNSKQRRQVFVPTCESESSSKHEEYSCAESVSRTTNSAANSRDVHSQPQPVSTTAQSGKQESSRRVIACHITGKGSVTTIGAQDVVINLSQVIDWKFTTDGDDNPQISDSTAGRCQQDLPSLETAVRKKKTRFKKKKRRREPMTASSATSVGVSLHDVSPLADIRANMSQKSEESYKKYERRPRLQIRLNKDSQSQQRQEKSSRQGRTNQGLPKRKREKKAPPEKRNICLLCAAELRHGVSNEECDRYDVLQGNRDESQGCKDTLQQEHDAPTRTDQHFIPNSTESMQYESHRQKGSESCNIVGKRQEERPDLHRGTDKMSKRPLKRRGTIIRLAKRKQHGTEPNLRGVPTGQKCNADPELGAHSPVTHIIENYRQEPCSGCGKIFRWMAGFAPLVLTDNLPDAVGSVYETEATPAGLCAEDQGRPLESCHEKQTSEPECRSSEKFGSFHKKCSHESLPPVQIRTSGSKVKDILGGHSGGLMQITLWMDAGGGDILKTSQTNTDISQPGKDESRNRNNAFAFGRHIRSGNSRNISQTTLIGRAEKLVGKTKTLARQIAEQEQPKRTINWERHELGGGIVWYKSVDHGTKLPGQDSVEKDTKAAGKPEEDTTIQHESTDSQNIVNDSNSSEDGASEGDRTSVLRFVFSIKESDKQTATDSRSDAARSRTDCSQPPLKDGISVGDHKTSIQHYNDDPSSQLLQTLMDTIEHEQMQEGANNSTDLGSLLDEEEHTTRADDGLSVLSTNIYHQTHVCPEKFNIEEDAKVARQPHEDETLNSDNSQHDFHGQSTLDAVTSFGMHTVHKEQEIPLHKTGSVCNSKSGEPKVKGHDNDDVLPQNLKDEDDETEVSVEEYEDDEDSTSCFTNTDETTSNTSNEQRENALNESEQEPKLDSQCIPVDKKEAQYEETLTTHSQNSDPVKSALSSHHTQKSNSLAIPNVSKIPSKVTQSWQQLLQPIQRFVQQDPRSVYSTSNMQRKMSVCKAFLQKIPANLLQKQGRTASKGSQAHLRYVNFNRKQGESDKSTEPTKVPVQHSPCTVSNVSEDHADGEIVTRFDDGDNNSRPIMEALTPVNLSPIQKTTKDAVPSRDFFVLPYRLSQFSDQDKYYISEDCEGLSNELKHRESKGKYLNEMHLTTTGDVSGQPNEAVNKEATSIENANAINSNRSLSSDEDYLFAEFESFPDFLDISNNCTYPYAYLQQNPAKFFYEEVPPCPYRKPVSLFTSTKWYCSDVSKKDRLIYGNTHQYSHGKLTCKHAVHLTWLELGEPVDTVPLTTELRKTWSELDDEGKKTECSHLPIRNIVDSQHFASVILRKRGLDFYNENSRQDVQKDYEKIDAAVLLKRLVATPETVSKRRERARKNWRSAWLQLKIVYIITKETEFTRLHERVSTFTQSLNKANQVFTRGHLYFDVKDFQFRNKEVNLSEKLQAILGKPSEFRTPRELNQVVGGLLFILRKKVYQPLSYLEYLAKYAWYMRVPPDRVIIRKYHPPVGGYLLLSGKVIVEDDNESLVVKAGDFFGEKEILYNCKRQNTVVSRTVTHLLFIPACHIPKVTVGTANQQSIIDCLRDKWFMRGFPLEALKDAAKYVKTFYFRHDAVIVENSGKSEWLYFVRSGYCWVGKIATRGMLEEHDKLFAWKLTSDATTGSKIDTGLRKERPRRPFPARRMPEWSEKRAGPAVTPRLRFRRKSESKAPQYFTMDEYLAELIKSRGFRIPPAFQYQERSVAQRPRERRRISVAAVDGSWMTREAQFSATSFCKDEHDGMSMPSETQSKPRKSAPDVPKASFVKPLSKDSAKRPDTECFIRFAVLEAGDIYFHRFGFHFVLAEITWGMDKLPVSGMRKSPCTCLVSQGAECVMLNKRFFTSHCPMDLLCKVINASTPYPHLSEVLDKLNEHKVRERQLLKFSKNCRIKGKATFCVH